MEPKKEGPLSRRELLYFLGGVAGANALGLGAWLTLEALAPEANADEYHKSVCRYCAPKWKWGWKWGRNGEMGTWRNGAKWGHTY
jgi:hypothetical protein